MSNDPPLFALHRNVSENVRRSSRVLAGAVHELGCIFAVEHGLVSDVADPTYENASLAATAFASAIICRGSRRKIEK